MPRHAPGVGASFFVMMNNQRCRLDGDAVRRPQERSIQNESKNPYEARRQVAGSARACLFEYAAERRLPAIYETDSLTREGGLMSYGPDRREIFERSAALVDRIFKGTKPADLPVEQPTRFLFVLNLKTAKAMGLNVPNTLLALADEVVE